MRIEKRKIRNWVIALGVIALVIGGVVVFVQHRADERRRLLRAEERRIELEQERRRAEVAKRLAQEEFEYEQRKYRADSIKLVNMQAINDAWDLARSKAPDYSDIELWRRGRDEWIMMYHKESGNKEHYFIQRFNASTREFGPAIECSTAVYKDLTEDPQYITPKNVRCKFTRDSRYNTLDYYEDGKHIGVYDRSSIRDRYHIAATTRGPLLERRINALKSAPPDWVEDGYESAEDYFYDNEEDLYFYYNP